MTKINRAVYVIGALFFVTAVYLLTISPFVQGGDSGEMAMVAARLRVPHPPGYPLYVYLAHLFTLLPWSTVAWRVALFSTLCQIGAGLILFDVLRRWLKRLDIALLVVVGYSLSPLTWTYATEAEVFALNNFFATLILWLVMRYHESRQDRWAYLSCLVSGLAFSHHQTSVILAFPMLMTYLILDWKKWLHPFKIGFGLVLFACGLTSWLLLFPLGQTQDLTSWGNIHSWQGLWTHVLRREYGTFQLALPGGNQVSLLQKVFTFLKAMALQTNIWGLAAALWMGHLVIKRQLRDQFAMAVTVSLIFFTLFINALSNVDPHDAFLYFILSRMWTLALLLIWVAAASGLVQAIEHWRLPPRYSLAGLLVVTLLVGVYHWPIMSRPNSELYEQVSRSMLEGTEKNAIVFVRGDTFVNSVRYTRYVLGVRPDTYVIPFDLLGHQWSREVFEKSVPGLMYPQDLPDFDLAKVGQVTFREVVLANLDKFPIYLPQLNGFEEELTRNGLQGFIYGYHTRIAGPSKTWPLEEINRETQKFLSIRMPDPRRSAWYSWEQYVISSYYDYKLAIGASLAMRANGDPQFIARAEEVFRSVAEQSESYKPKALMQIGFLYSDLVNEHPEYRPRAIEAWEKYVQTHPGESQETREGLEILAKLKSGKKL